MTSFDIVVAADLDNGIAKGGELPWHIPEDMAYFKRLTQTTADAHKHNAVVMGRKTWESIPKRFRPLAGRRNLVLTRREDFVAPDAVAVARTLDEALGVAAGEDACERTFVVGGADVYAQALAHPACQRVYLTRIHARYGCDAFFPRLGPGWRQRSTDERCTPEGLVFVFEVYEHADARDVGV